MSFEFEVDEEGLAGRSINSLVGLSRLQRRKLNDAGVNQIGQLVAADPIVIMLKCLLGNSDILQISTALNKVYKKLPRRWKRDELRFRLKGEGSPFPKLYKPEIEVSVVKRYFHRISTGKHYKKPRKNRRVW